MKRCHQCSTDKALSEFHKGGTHPECKACVQKRNAAYRSLHSERLKLSKRAYRNSNKAKIAEKDRLYREKNREVLREKDAAKHQRNKRERSDRMKGWRAQNAHVVNALSQKAKAARLRAIPPWADLEAIKAIYKEAQEVTTRTGVEHHVDHIVPLQSAMVCGLHCEANLRVIPAAENQKKFNKLDEALALAA
jgi:hypothetical protein